MSALPSLTEGDLVEINLRSRRYAYAQQLGPSYLKTVPFTRVMPGLFQGKLSLVEVEKLGREVQSQFWIQFPLALLIRNNLAQKIGTVPIPNQFEIRPPLRTFVKKSERNPAGWHIVVSDEVASKGFRTISGNEYSQLFPAIDQLSLSVWTVPGIGTFLRMVEMAWKHERAVDITLGMTPNEEEVLEDPESCQTRFFCQWSDYPNAVKAKIAFDKMGFTSEIAHDSPFESAWTVIAIRAGPLSSDVEGDVVAVVERFGGTYDGNETGPI